MLNKQEKDNWCSLKLSSVEFDEYMSCDVSVCEIQSVDHVMQDHLTWGGGEEEEGGGGGGEEEEEE